MKFGKGMNLNCFPYRGESILFSQNFIPLFFFPTTRIETSIHRSLIKSIRHRSLSCLLFINETTILSPHYGLLVSFYIRIYFFTERNLYSNLSQKFANQSFYLYISSDPRTVRLSKRFFIFRIAIISYYN